MRRQQEIPKSRNRVSCNEDEITRAHMISPHSNRSSPPRLPRSILKRNDRNNQNEMPQVLRQQEVNFYPNVSERVPQLNDDDNHHRQIRSEPLARNHEYRPVFSHQQANQNYGNAVQFNQFSPPFQSNYTPSFNQPFENEEPYSYDNEDLEEEIGQNESNNYHQRQIQGNNQNHFETQVNNERFQPNHDLRAPYQGQFESMTRNNFETPSSSEQFMPNRGLQNAYQNHIETGFEQRHSTQGASSSYDYQRYENSSFADNSGDKVHGHSFNAQTSSAPQKRKQVVLDNDHEAQQKRRSISAQNHHNSSLQNNELPSQTPHNSNDSSFHQSTEVEQLKKQIKEVELKNRLMSKALQYERDNSKKQSEDLEEKLHQATQLIEKLEADKKELVSAKNKEFLKNLAQSKQIVALQHEITDKNNEVCEAYAKLETMGDVKDQFKSYKTKMEKRYDTACDDRNYYRDKSSEYKKDRDKFKCDLEEKEKSHKATIHTLEDQIEKLKQAAIKLTSDKSIQTDSKSTADISIQTLSEVKLEQLLERDDHLQINEQGTSLMDGQAEVTQDMNVFESAQDQSISEGVQLTTIEDMNASESAQDQNMSEGVQSIATQEQSLLVDVKMEEVVQEQEMVEETDPETLSAANQSFTFKEVKPEIIDADVTQSEILNPEAIQSSNDEELAPTMNATQVNKVETLTEEESNTIPTSDLFHYSITDSRSSTSIEPVAEDLSSHRLPTVDEVPPAMTLPINEELVLNLPMNNNEATSTLPCITEDSTPNEQFPWLALGLSEQEYIACVQAEENWLAENDLNLTEDEKAEATQAQEEFESQRRLSGHRMNGNSNSQNSPSYPGL